jgi:acyl-CoA thioester hydrolase
MSSSPSDFVVTIVARWADIDLNQHMRHSDFADCAAHTRTEWLNANGLPIEKLVELKMAPVMFEDGTRYLKEVRLGERIHIELQLAGADGDGAVVPTAHLPPRRKRLCRLRSQRGLV